MKALSALIADSASAMTDEATTLARELTDRMQRLERIAQQSERARTAEADANALEKKMEERDAQMLFMLDQLRHTKAELDVAHRELGEDRDHLLKLQSGGLVARRGPIGFVRSTMRNVPPVAVPSHPRVDIGGAMPLACVSAALQTPGLQYPAHRKARLMATVCT